jgi:hypothetical protein
MEFASDRILRPLGGMPPGIDAMKEVLSSDGFAIVPDERGEPKIVPVRTVIPILRNT